MNSLYETKMTQTRAGTIYLLFLIPILAFYLWWLLAYNVHDENTIWAFVTIIGILYIVAAICAFTGHPMFASCAMFLSLIFVLSIAGVSGFKKADGTKDPGFICLGVTPFLSAVMLTCIGSCIAFWLRDAMRETEYESSIEKL
jgi:hypothetical protein